MCVCDRERARARARARARQRDRENMSVDMCIGLGFAHATEARPFARDFGCLFPLSRATHFARVYQLHRGGFAQEARGGAGGGAQAGAYVKRGREEGWERENSCMHLDEQPVLLRSCHHGDASAGAGWGGVEYILGGGSRLFVSLFRNVKFIMKTGHQPAYRYTSRACASLF